MEIVAVLKQAPFCPGAEYTLPGSDENMLCEALHLRDAYGGRVSALILGDETACGALKKAYSMGVDTACLVDTRGLARPDVFAAAGIMAAAVQRREAFDLVLCGRQAIDGDSARFAALLAYRLCLPQVLYAKGISAEGRAATIKRHTELGDYVYQVTLPALVMTVNDMVPPRFSQVADIMAAYSGEKHIDIVAGEALSNAPGPCLCEKANLPQSVGSGPKTQWFTGSESDIACELLSAVRRLAP